MWCWVADADVFFVFSLIGIGARNVDIKELRDFFNCWCNVGIFSFLACNEHVF